MENSNRLDRARRGVAAIGLSVSCLKCGVSQVTPGDVALLAERGQHQRAIELLETQVLSDTNNPEPLRLLIRTHASAGDWHGVETTLVRLISVSPSDSPEPWLELGHAHELLHEFDQALAAYDRASKVSPTSARGPFVAGRRAARWGWWNVAADRMREAVRREPNRPELWHTLGFSLLAGGDIAGAQAAYSNGLGVNSSSLANRIGLATVALRREDYTLALSHYDALIEAQSKFAEAHLGRSWTLLRLGRLAEADDAISAAESLGADADIVRRQRTLLGSNRGKASFRF